MGRRLGWVALVFIACSGTREAPAVSATVEDLLWGGTDCRRGDQCPSGICSGGLCVGYLGASTEEDREAIGPALVAAATRGPGEEVQQALVEVLSSTGSDEFIRGRAADAFRWLPLPLGRETLQALETDPSEPVRFFAARARQVRGDPGARGLLDAFARHPSEAVRMLATRALGSRRESGSQGPISQ